MKYTKFQKFLSSFLIFSMLSGITFRLPFFDFLASASGSEYYDLVSIIVDEDTYSDITSELKRYSKDITNVLENTKVVILPVPKTATSYDIASMNEALYYEGYKGLKDVSFESKLVGTVLVGNLPLPLVYKDSEVSKTILPYTDFDDKTYIYDSVDRKYKYNIDNQKEAVPEVWHGVISPNTGDDGDDTDALKTYFDKNHDYYTGNGLYDLSKNSINGNLDEYYNKDYEPYVFYFDAFRESKSVNYNSYVGYKGYLENKEDINYNRFTKDLANKLKQEILGNSNNSISELAKKVNPNLDPSLLSSVDTSLDNIPDIQSRYIINSSIKKFLEIFSPGSIGDLRKNVYNAGRYNTKDEVNVDFIPYFISVLDIVNDQIIKELNDELEGQIDSLVSNGLSRKIAIPTTYDYVDEFVNETYENYLFGNKASNITSAEQCSIYRGSLSNSGQLVESNRGLNIFNIEPDKNTLSPFGNICLTNLQSGASLEGLWGRNSPFNLNQSETAKGNMVLNTNTDYKGAIVNLYDIDGSKKITDSSKVQNPFFCADNNYLLANKLDYDSFSSNWTNSYKIPTYGSNSLQTGVPGWQCITNTNGTGKVFNFTKTFDQNYLSLSAGLCEKKIIKLDGVIVKQVGYTEYCSGLGDCECSAYSITDPVTGLTTDSTSKWKVYTYDYKTIDSFITHKSPTSTELTKQINSMIAPSLAVDKDRYIDFISANASYAKINYPYLYRLKLENVSDISLDKVSVELDKVLQDKSDEINNLINNSSVGIVDSNLSNTEEGNFLSDLSGILSGDNSILPVNEEGNFLTELFGLIGNGDINEKNGLYINNSKINNYFTTGNYPTANFDLKSYLKNKGSKTITIGGESKKISYYDMLVFAIYWNNLNSVSSKYGFVFENYLSNQFSDNEKYFLPKNKKTYEIAYLGASGDASNMFVGIDPEAKATNPYSSIIGQNQDISTKLLGLNIGKTKTSNESLFKCAPPEGVPIWEWMPAVMCRLGDMMPPTLAISDGACGPALLSNEEKAELNSCSGDVNKNGVNDCIENKLSVGSISLESDSDKYYYNNNVELRAILKGSDGKNLTFLNSTDINFEIVKAEIANDETKDLSDANKKILFDIDDTNKNNVSLLTKYVTFKDLKVRSSAGMAKYGITTKNNDANIYLRASVNINDNKDSNVIDLSSNILKIEIRGESIFVSTYNLKNGNSGLEVQSGISSVVASDKTNLYLIDGYKSTIDETSELINNNSTSTEKLVIKLDNISKSRSIIANSYPIELELYKNDKLLEKNTFNDISGFKPLFSLKEAGTYTLKIKDNFGSLTQKTFEVLPSNPVKLDLNLSTNYLQKGGSLSTNYITILDKFDNPVSGEFYDLKMNIDGNSLLFVDNDKTDFTTTTYEGYKIFRLKTTDKSGKSTVNISLNSTDGKLLLSTSKDVNVLDSFQIDAVSTSGAFYVGGGSYKYKVDVKDKDGNLLTNFNSRVYMTANSSYIDLVQPYFDIVNGVGIIEFSTRTTAGKNIPIELQIEGLGQIVTKTIDILPDVAMKIDLVLSKAKIEANTTDYSNVNVELKDRFNNLVYTDSTTQANLEILPEYSHVLSSDKTQTIFKDGKANFKVYGTVNPGVGYFKVSTNPSLALNSFTILDENGNIVVNGVGENAAKIESFYVWNKDKIAKSSYNSIYTTLLGANYGDVEQVDYLAGSLIFDKNSKALAVTSILNNPYLANNTFSISKNAGFLKMYSPNDLSQDISTNVGFKDSKLYIDIFNNSLNTHIGEINYAFPDNTNLLVCDSDISDCLNNSKTTIFGKYLDENYRFYTSGGKLYLRDSLGKSYLEVDEKGNITRTGNISFEVNSNSNDYLELNLKSGSDIIGKLGFDFVDSSINVTRDKTAYDSKVSTSKNTILLYLDSSFYGSYISGKAENESLIVYYNDPFASNNSLNTFSKSNSSSYENFKTVGGLGWGGENKTLLSFSAGKTVGESLKENMSFSAINIGDPVISLKSIRKTFNDSTNLKQFDSTIGDVINNEDDLEGYRVFDYNNDSKDDILLIKNTLYLKLLENIETSSRFLDKGNLAYVVDLGSPDLIKTGDFTGDGYDDIFFVGEDGKPYLLNNINKDFSRLSLANKFNLNGNIIRAESFDMDNDGIDDIVTLDDAGEINIFYGSSGSVNPTFTKLTVSDDYGISLNKDIRNDGGLVYYDGLYQVDYTYDNSDLISENQKYLANVQSSIDNGTVKDKKETVDYDLVNSFIFEQLAYSKSDSLKLSDINSVDSLAQLPDTISQTTFIKSDFSDSAGIKVEKVFLDRNGDYLSKGDFVDVEVKLTNISGKKLNNIAYVEDVLDYFTLDDKSITNSKNLEAKKPNNNYDFLIDQFSLNSNETLTINYTGVVKPLQYGYMQVGLFELGEAGDDNYGDIILKDDLENCSDPVEIFRSTSTRLYNKGTKNPSCDTSSLPESVLNMSVDSDNNGVPDYIENLTKSTTALSQYSKETLSDLFKDSDSDGIPDDEDSFNTVSGDITFDLGNAGSSINSGLDSLQSTVNGLSCGFSNGSCISAPLNWAPLAPGNDPVFNGKLQLDDLNIGEGIPIFSALTRLDIGFSPYCITIPSIYPISPMSLNADASCSSANVIQAWGEALGEIGSPDTSSTFIGAGGYFGTNSASNFFRLFVTPTLTGGVGLAACFGGPASKAGNANMPGISPLFPGGNCIVAAKPLLGCSNDGSEGDPASIGYPVYGNSFGVINGNCSVDEQNYIDKNYVNNYYNYITGKGSYSSLGSVKNAVSTHTNAGHGPLFSLGTSGTPVSVKINPSAGGFDYSDVTKISKKRIQAFPGFLMNWVTRQIEEIVNKLTDFPTLFIILPDFSGIFDTDLDWQTNKENWMQRSGNKDRTQNDVINMDALSSKAPGLAEDAKKYSSGIKEAYEFMGSLPIVKIEQVPVDMSLPWISETEIDKTLLTRGKTLDSRKKEYTRAQNSWSLGKTCSYTDPDKQAECEKYNNESQKVALGTQTLISSLEANIEVLKSYKEIPQKINKYLNKKEYYLEQILCDINSISSMLGGRIGKNGERFKAWVELFILIKSILKSWQLLIDVFVDYEQECKECKNERQDSLTSEFELISMVVPDIPVIQFPKWPDIILDLHNIRAALNIQLPEFEVTPRPILLPELPNLYLSDAPNVNITFPSIPVLPKLEIPELPDLPTIPSVELPDLPPPPTLPKMFSQLEAILDILKLVTKAMCILKSSPFVPEWRAGDQIAFLTERSGYLGTDYLNLSLPQFSFPFIDAIKVTTYVNLEFDTEFIVELARQTAMPINSFTADFTNIFNINVNDLDFRNVTPSDVNIDTESQTVNPNVGYNNSIKKLVASILVKNILSGKDYISKNTTNTISNLEFKKEVGKNLASEAFSSDSRFDELRDLWKNVENYTFSGEDKVISDLQKNNLDKFETLKDIVNTEIIKNKQFKSDFNNLLNNPIKKVSKVDNSDEEKYNSMLDKYNSNAFEKTKALVNYDESTSVNAEIKKQGNDLLASTNTALSKYTSGNTSKNDTSKLLAANTTNTSNTTNSCTTSQNANSDYGYNYEGLYILENNKSYRLFDYKDELQGDEETTIIDFDNDSDEDLLYFANNILYLKENLGIKDKKVYLNESPLILDSSDNKFLNGDTYISAVNNAKSNTSTSSFINISFSGIKNINNYRLSFYNVVDKFLNERLSTYIPEYRKKSVIDAIAGIDDINLVEDKGLYIERKDIVNISNVGDLRGIEVSTDELKDIKDDLINGNVVSISNGTKIYSGDENLVLKYFLPANTEVKSIIVPKHRYIEVTSTINVVGITGNGYVKTGGKITYSGTDIRSLIGKPLFEGTKIVYVGNNLDVRDDTYIDLKYYDDSEVSLEFKYISDWELYNLGYESDKYLITNSRKNDFYYSKVLGFKNNINSTISNQILLSPQIQADNNSPELNMSTIRVPVYQKQDIDITKYIFENSGIEGIAKISLDFDLDKDTSLDGNPKNDDDSSTMDNLNFIKSDDKIILEVGVFEELFNKKIGISITDKNGNVGYAEVPFEIYSPIPEINSLEGDNISGVLDENLDNEPVSLYRVRGGMVSKLANNSGDNLTLSNSGSYDFLIGTGSTSGVKIEKNNTIIANVNEKTGKITLKDNIYKIDVLESNNLLNDSIFPKIILKDTFEDIFYEVLSVNGNKVVKVIDDFAGIVDSGVYVQFLNSTNYNYYVLPENVDYNPGSLVIYRIADTEKEPLFTIFSDGRINTVNSNYSLKYDYYADYVVIKLYDKHFDREVASVLYKINSDYIIK
ncbi:MAG: VCBS repeat-containing protein [Candidatus Gracilibacteria bacterium]|nr:VCBS repeat-containing protein [Candidatus Gracilibacteria bacterium]